jgi:hypothetical protein
MSWIECGSCEEMVDVCGGTVRLPYICGRCEKDSALAEEVHGLYIEEGDDLPCNVPYNSGVPCQSALDSAQAEHYLDPYAVGESDPRVHAMQDEQYYLDRFYTKVINDLRMQLSQVNKNVQIQGEMIADLENTLGAYRVIFRIPGY